MYTIELVCLPLRDLEFFQNSRPPMCMTYDAFSYFVFIIHPIPQSPGHIDILYVFHDMADCDYIHYFPSPGGMI